MKKPSQRQIQWAANEFAKNEMGEEEFKADPLRATAIKYYFTAGCNLVLHLLKPLTKI